MIASTFEFIGSIGNDMRFQPSLRFMENVFNWSSCFFPIAYPLPGSNLRKDQKIYDK